jgi:rhodanese-related sulfurtransferase
MFRSVLKPCLAIVIFASAMAVGYNLFMPGGLPFLPPEISRPLWQEIDSQEALQEIKAGAALIDARPAGDFNVRRVRGAVKMPVQNLDYLYGLLQNSLRKAPAVIVYGRTFSTFPAATVGQYLRGRGFEKVYVLRAGLDELEKAGFPIHEPKRRAEQS